MNPKNQGTTRSKKTSVLLHLDTSHQRKEDGKSRFYLKVRVQGKAQLYDITPELHMNRKFWVHETDPESGGEKKRMRIQHAKGNPDSRRFEMSTLARLNEMSAIIDELAAQGQAVTHAMLEQRWKGAAAKTFAHYIGMRMDEEREDVRKSTYVKWRASLRAIEAYDPQVLLTEITPEWLREYEDYLRHSKPHVRIMETSGGTSTVKTKGQGLGQNAITGNFKFIGKYLRDAQVRNFITRSPMDAYMLESKGRRRIGWVTPNRNVLSGTEIDRLQAAYDQGELAAMFPNDKGMKYHNVLQQVLASVYSGFRFSDIAQFQDQMKVAVTETHLKLTMRKTDKAQTIKITKRLRSVLSLDNGGSLFDAPIMANAAMNINLRRVLGLLGIDKYMSWHDLRRTFASQLQAMNVDIKKVSKLMGHSSVVITEKYVKTHDHDLDRAMDAWDDEPASPTTVPDRKLLGLVVELVERNPNLVVPSELGAMLASYARAV